jgi:hypothetical protein
VPQQCDYYTKQTDIRKNGKFWPATKMTIKLRHRFSTHYRLMNRNLGGMETGIKENAVFTTDKFGRAMRIRLTPSLASNTNGPLNEFRANENGT